MGGGGVIGIVMEDFGSVAVGSPRHGVVAVPRRAPSSGSGPAGLALGLSGFSFRNMALGPLTSEICGQEIRNVTYCSLLRVWKVPDPEARRLVARVEEQHQLHFLKQAAIIQGDYESC
ncbi:hypothetical protein NDU88_006759 [Pleurodeles waltl]|uniref:Uncharacterized protein n=1 Tax=Pleurodeles waltl TaxID=8319 RepID=A0AAV7PMT3_PLEWA|nr:hypothetical protein NDU88_006759 [Pleurodeles waltl]